MAACKLVRARTRRRSANRSKTRICWTEPSPEAVLQRTCVAKAMKEDERGSGRRQFWHAMKKPISMRNNAAKAARPSTVTGEEAPGGEHSPCARTGSGEERLVVSRASGASPNELRDTTLAAARELITSRSRLDTFGAMASGDTLNSKGYSPRTSVSSLGAKTQLRRHRYRKG
jgi:hypothetical protein